MSALPLPPFHLAIPVRDLAEARKFYGEILGCPEGRSAPEWVDFNFFGHQLVCHRTATNGGNIERNPVDGHDVPVPHFGAVLESSEWHALAERVRAAGIRFEIEPQVRFKGEPGEQSTMFFFDPSGNAIEFKSFQNIAAQLFAK